MPSGTFGNAGRNNLRGPNWQSLDMSLQKRFNTGRSSNVTFRWDVFNVFNTVNLACPTRTSRARAVGTISQLAGDARVMQFSLRVGF